MEETRTNMISTKLTYYCSFAKREDSSSCPSLCRFWVLCWQLRLNSRLTFTCSLIVLLALISGLITTGSASSNLGNLKTFQAYACDDQKLNITCPHGTKISVQLAQYGSQVANLCAPRSTTEIRLPEATDNTSCISSSSLQYALFQVVVQQCQERRQCKILTSPSTFGHDPCPGIRKYAEVTFKCRPNEFVTKIICEGDPLHLKCPKGSRIAIYQANFGRSKHGSVECPQPEGVPDEECQASFATEMVMRTCHGQRKCTMIPDVQTFGDPCTEKKTRRYLRVVFTCVPSKILIPMNHSPDYDDGDPEVDGDEEIVEEPSYKPPPTDGENHYNTLSKDPMKPKGGGGGEEDLSPTAPVSTTKDVQGDDSEEDVKGLGTDDSSQINCTVPGYSGDSDDNSVGVIKEWITAFNFLRGNKEKLILYLSVSIATGLVVLMLVVIVRLMIQKRRERKRAKLNISEPLPNGFSDDISDIDQDITDLSHSSPPRQDPSVAVVRYTSRSTMRRQDSDTNPRAPITTRGQNNFYYS